MLILARRVDESIVVADGEIVITMLSIVGDKVRLGITAPIEVPVHRHEVFDAIQREIRDGTRRDGKGAE